MSSTRIYSIDVFRAITMLLMIFVNDFWTLTGIPSWLEHSAADQDFLGFSDIIFPSFLFIVGMSVPYAIQNRLAKGDSRAKIFLHILLRSVALLIMGFFTVNISDINAAASGISRRQFMVLMVVAFFLIWNVYPRSEGAKKWVFRGLQAVGAALLLGLFLIFKGGADGSQGMTPQWWGILGLIGWTYLVTSALYLFLFQRNIYLIAALLFFALLNIADHAGWIKSLLPNGPQEMLPGNGAFQLFAFLGIVATLLLEQYKKAARTAKLPLVYFGLGAVLIAAGTLSRHFFIISKIHATPTWVFLCSGIAFITFALVFWLVDLRGKVQWFDVIKTAGTATLTCYMIPYLFDIPIKGLMAHGVLGLTKSMLYAFLVIGIANLLGRFGVKLKI